MSTYPDAIYSPRAKANKTGVVYDAAKTKVIFAEDVVKDDDEIVAVETELGTNAKGAFASVKAWLTDLASKVISAFTDIPDVPASYVDQAGKVLVVKATEDGLEFGAGGGGLTYVEIAPPAVSNPSSAATWEDWNISAYVPDGTKYVEILIIHVSTSQCTLGVRKNGSAITRSLLSQSIAGDSYHMTTEPDANRVVERYVSGVSSRAKFTVVGYWI